MACHNVNTSATEQQPKPDLLGSIFCFNNELKYNPRLAGNVALVFTLLFIEIDIGTTEMVFMLKSKLVFAVNFILRLLTLKQGSNLNRNRIASVQKVLLQLR
mmetsp:Transcript_15828/g.20261  ORF Transcript_15828/g.20261 Transcript_15828/m.20261 type:complete len:102 (-) Transcript_15828:1328-1633(-)